MVHTFHFGNYPHKPAGDLWMERIFCRTVDRLIAVGHVQRAQIRAAHHLSDDAIGAVRNGVQVPLRGGGDPAFRASIGAEGKVLVGTIATMIPQKGLTDLLSVARRVRDQRNDVHFVLIGEGILRPELERMRADLGLTDTVTFTGWLTDAASLALPSFDIYFQPSLWEAMSISILEAMAAGKAVVSTQVGEAPHLIGHGSEGLLFQPHDVEGMSSAILALSQQAGQRRSMGDAAARKVADHFTVSQMTRAYEEVYLKVLQRDHGRVTHAAR